MKRTLHFVTVSLLVIVCLPFGRSSYAQEPFIGEIRMFGFTFCPRGWTEADGQLLSIASNSPLFSLYGTTYGGDGRTTFALPDLRGRVPVHVGQGPGLSSYALGQKGGVETITLTAAEMPAHTHTVVDLTNSNGTTPGLAVRNGSGDQEAPTSSAGGSQPHENRPPYLTMRYCVALQGIFPSRN